MASKRHQLASLAYELLFASYCLARRLQAPKALVKKTCSPFLTVNVSVVYTMEARETPRIDLFLILPTFERHLIRAVGGWHHLLSNSKGTLSAAVALAHRSIAPGLGKNPCCQRK